MLSDEFLADLPPVEKQKLVSLIAKTQKFGLQIAARKRWINKTLMAFLNCEQLAQTFSVDCIFMLKVRIL